MVPVGRGPAPVEESGRRQDTGAGADRGDATRHSAEAAHVGYQTIVIHGVDVADAARHDQGVNRATGSLQGDLGLDGQPGAGVVGAPPGEASGPVERRPVSDVGQLQRGHHARDVQQLGGRVSDDQHQPWPQGLAGPFGEFLHEPNLRRDPAPGRVSVRRDPQDFGHASGGGLVSGDGADPWWRHDHDIRSRSPGRATMTTPTGRVIANITISADGYVAGPNQTEEHPFGDDSGDGFGDRLHAWMFEHGEENRAEVDEIAAYTAVIMGRNMFGPVRGAWDRKWKGWWGEEPVFHAPVFVLTHHPRDPQPMKGGTTYHFVTDGIEAALAQARAAAGDGDVSILGGADTINQYLAASLVDELRLHIAAFTLGAGARLFDGVPPLGLEQVKSRASCAITHLTYRVPAGTGQNHRRPPSDPPPPRPSYS